MSIVSAYCLSPQSPHPPCLFSREQGILRNSYGHTMWRMTSGFHCQGVGYGLKSAAPLKQPIAISKATVTNETELSLLLMSYRRVRVVLQETSLSHSDLPRPLPEPMWNTNRNHCKKKNRLQDTAAKISKYRNGSYSHSCNWGLLSYQATWMHEFTSESHFLSWEKF